MTASQELAGLGGDVLYFKNNLVNKKCPESEQKILYRPIINRKCMNKQTYYFIFSLLALKKLMLRSLKQFRIFCFTIRIILKCIRCRKLLYITNLARISRPVFLPALV
jgi:hypothetical protein